MINKGLFTSLRENWKTPKKFYEELDKEFNFNFDPCPSNPKFNGLEIEWRERNFVNPPYGGEIGKWIKKGFEESQKGRLCFDDTGNPAPFPSAVVIFLGKNKGKGTCSICMGTRIDKRTYPSTECLCLKEDRI